MPTHTIPNFAHQESPPASVGRPHPYGVTQRARLLIVLSGAVLLGSTVLLTLLNALGVLHLSAIWLTVLDTVLVVLGVGSTLGQWLIPLAPIFTPSPQPPEAPAVAHSQLALSPVETLRKTIEGELNPRLPKGALVIVTGEQALSMPIRIVPHRTWLAAASPQAIPGALPGTHTQYVKHIRCGESVLCAAIFRDQVPDEYLAQSDFHASTPIPIFEHEASSIDWR